MDWAFLQKGGAKKVLRLSGWDAPHGRPRQKPVVSDGLVARQSTNYYPGNDKPTRHSFGHRFEPFELEGRWMDIYGGRGYANQMAEFAKGFVDDQLEVLITWGDIIACEGFIDSIVCGREGIGNIAYKLKVQIDEDLLLTTKKSKQPLPDNLADLTNKLNNALSAALGSGPGLNPITEFPPSLDLGIADTLDSLVSAINTPAAVFTKLVNDIGSLETATIGELRRLRAGIGQIKTGIQNLQTTYSDLQTDTAIQSSLASEAINFDSYRASSLAAMDSAIDSIRNIDRAASIAERGSIKAFYTGRSGDTWESISTAVYGVSTRASDIQAANDEPDQPSPGTLYVIPV